MADSFTITTDTAALFAAMDAIPAEVHARLKAAARVTADNIVKEARARVARATGALASHIVVDETYTRDGWIVWVEPDVQISWHTMSRSGHSHTQKVTYNALGGWIEFGTKFMTARPFLFVSARLEESAHDRRSRAAVQGAIDAKGLGD